MWSWIKKLFQKNDQSSESSTGDEFEFKWYEVGVENPFPFRVLDVRSLTWNVLATTKDPAIAESFNRQRQTDGREFVGAEIEDFASIECNIILPHNGAELEGIVFKADSMEVKWDIYVYDSVFLFVRSWTGELQYRAFAEVARDRICIRKIESHADEAELAAAAVYFILATHAMGIVLPHTIPRYVPDDPQQIALISFSMYGKLACYATYEDITTMPIPSPRREA